MEGGRVPSAGNKRSNAASTASRSSSKKEGEFIAGEGRADWGCVMRIPPRSRFGLFFRLEGLRRELSVGLLQQNLHAPLCLLQLLLALARELYSFFEQFHGFVQGELRAFETAHNFLEPGEGLLEIGLLQRLSLFHRNRIHAINLPGKSNLPIVRHVQRVSNESPRFRAAILRFPASALTYVCARVIPLRR